MNSLQSLRLGNDRLQNDMRGDGVGEELEVDYFRSLYNGC